MSRIPLCTVSRPRHAWERAKFGCRENPGVVDNGNGAIVITDRCRWCGITRQHTRYHDPRRRNRVTYLDAS